MGEVSAPLATLRQKCPFCGKNALEKARKKMGKSFMVSLECGHTIFQARLETTIAQVESGKTAEQIEIEEAEKFVSSDGKHAYPYQMRSAKFFEACGMNGICAHEMGVGKMVISCILAKRNKKQVTPMLFVCKSGLRYQAFLEIVRWTGMIPQIIESSSDLPHFEYFPIIIISYDTLRLVRPDITLDWERENEAHGQVEERVGLHRGKVKGAKKIKWSDEICAKFKHIVLDECQLIKNPEASRTRAIKRIASAWQRVAMGKAPRIMGLSGTPIKNDASEYAPILHLVNPTMFPSETGFIARHCTQIGDSSRYRLRNPEAFHEQTKDFILRYTRAEVLPELPAISRTFRYAEIQPGAELERYQEVIKEFQEFMDKKESISMRDITNLLGFFSRMRRITGVAKVSAAMDFIEEFLLGTERKLVVFLHHKETAATLFAALEKLMAEGGMDAPLSLHSGLSMMGRQDIVAQFKGVTIKTKDDGTIEEIPTGKNHRVMIASTQAAGEGLNLQFASDCLIMERQWNPANEEQAEARFPRPGSLLTGTGEKVNATYLIAAGCIDDFLTELVERKRSIVASTLDNKELKWDESSLMVELANILHVKGLTKWQV